MQPNLAERTVLVVDDDRSILRLFERTLGRAELRVETASDLASAMRLLQERSFACALVDKNLGRGNGLELVRHIREHHPETDSLVITAYANFESAVEALRMGASDYLVKPFELETLLHRVRLVLERRRANAETAQMRAMLAQSERLASVGTLAAGVAHEVNNPLTYVIGNLEVSARLVAKLRQPPANAELLAPRVLEQLSDVVAEALEGANRIQVIAADLRTLSRRDEDAPVPVDLQRVIGFALRLAGPELKRRARVVAELEGAPKVLGTEGRLGQVFLNLLVNASHALSGALADNEVRVRATWDSESVHVAVADTGSGMSPEVLARIFEPFFTTKPAGTGTGLGLAICQRIIESFGGRIEVRSEIGRGTTFVVTLRRAEAAGGAGAGR